MRLTLSANIPEIDIYPACAPWLRLIFTPETGIAERTSCSYTLSNSASVFEENSFANSFPLELRIQ
jgi:hypothetical protein